MRCFLTLLWKSQWAAYEPEVHNLMVERRFKRAGQETETWVAELPTAAAAQFVHDFLAWVHQATPPESESTILTPSEIGALSPRVPRRPEMQRGLPPWALVATSRQLQKDWDRSPDTLPKWILAEFHNTVFVESDLLEHLRAISPNLASQFKMHPQFGLYTWRWSPEPVRQREKAAPYEPTVVPLSELRNGEDDPPQCAITQASSFEEVLKIAGTVYRDLSAGPLGGRNAMVLLSVELNGIGRNAQPTGTFAFYNLKALRLRYSSRPDSLANLVKGRTVELLEVIAEPSMEEKDGVPRSSES